MIVIDRMLASGLKFVLGKIAAAVDAELNDDGRLREELLAAQMRLELGELTAGQFAAIEADLVVRLREIRARQLGEAAGASGDFKVTGVEATAYDGKE